MDESESDDGYSDVSGKYLYLADGGRIRLTSPRFRKALQQTGIILEELFEVPQDKFFRGDWELAEREWEAYDGKRHGPFGDGCRGCGGSGGGCRSGGCRGGGGIDCAVLAAMCADAAGLGAVGGWCCRAQTCG